MAELDPERGLIQKFSRTITGLKNGDRPEPNAPSLQFLEDRRRDHYARVKELDAVVKKFEALRREIIQLESAATIAGCDVGRGSARPPRTGVETAIDDLLELDSPNAPATNSLEEMVGVAGVRGNVEVETLGSKGPLTKGTRLPLDFPTTFRTGPGSSVTIQVGSVRKTLQPNSSIKVVPKGNGQVDFVEQGGATIDVRKPGAYQIQTPNATANVDGTIFTVSYDPSTRTTGVAVEDGRVAVRPRNPGAARGVTLTPAEYVEVTRDAMTAVLPAPGAVQAGGAELLPDPIPRAVSPPIST